MHKKEAETVALQALSWLLANDELRSVFLNSTGADEATLRSATTDMAQLGAVLEFLTMNDAWIVAFCDDEGHEYTDPMRALAWFSEDRFLNWT